MERNGGRVQLSSAIFIIFILFLALLFFKSPPNFQNDICGVDINLSIYQNSFGNSFGSSFESSWLLRMNNNLKPREKRRLSKSRVLYYGNTTATLTFNLILLAGDAELNPGMSENGFESRTKRSVQRNIRIAHLNVRSIKNREHFILTKELVMKNDFDIFTVSESWLDNTVQDLEVEIPTFKIVIGSTV